MHRAHILVAALMMGAAGTSGAMARMINLPGTVKGGVDMCHVDTHKCITSPDDGNAKVDVISYRDGEGQVVINYNGQRYVVWPNQVIVKYKGCEVNVASIIMNKLPPAGSCRK